MVEPVLPGARGPRRREPGEAAQAEGAGPTVPGASAPAPLFGGRQAVAPDAPSPAAVLAAFEVLPAGLEAQLAQRPDGPALAPLLATLFPAAPGREDGFAAEALQGSRAIQERAAALTAEIAQRDLNGHLGRLADQLMDHAAPGLIERARRAFGKASRLDASAAMIRIEALKRDLKILLPPTQRLDREAAAVVKELDAGRTALTLAMPWLDPAAGPRRLRLIEAALAGCNLVPAQARQLLEQLNEHADRLETLESATLPALRNAQEARRLARPD